jgi:hypothetical protein
LAGSKRRRIDFLAGSQPMLTDDANSCPTTRPLLLDGFRYDRIGGDPPVVDAEERTSWLEQAVAQTRERISGRNPGNMRSKASRMVMTAKLIP